MARNRSCKEAGEALKACIERTACYDSNEKSMQECLADDEDTRISCHDVHHAYTRCKMELVDPRSRIQGVKTSGASTFFKGTDTS